MTFPYKVTFAYDDGRLAEFFFESRWGAEYWASLEFVCGATSATLEFAP